MKKKRETHTSVVMKKLREKKGITQVEFAHKLGLANSQFISNIENSKCLLPLDKIKKASKILSTSTRPLLKAHTIDCLLQTFASYEKHGFRHPFAGSEKALLGERNDIL